MLLDSASERTGYYHRFAIRAGSLCFYILPPGAENLLQYICLPGVYVAYASFVCPWARDLIL